MSKVTSKLQVTIPKTIASAHRIRPGTEVVFQSAGEDVRVHIVREKTPAGAGDVAWRLRLFDEATTRQALRNRRFLRRGLGGAAERGWRREDLYTRGLPR